MAIASSVLNFQSTSRTSYWSEKYTTIKENLPGVYKAQKIALDVLAGLSSTASVSVGVATIISAVTFPAGLSAFLVLLAVAGTFILLSRNIVDYNDPTTLQALRKEVSFSTFDQCVKRHSLKIMLKYSIPEPARFNELVKGKVQSLSFVEGRKFHIQLLRLVAKYTGETSSLSSEIQSLIDWNAKWREETRGLPCSTILEKYPIELLNNTPNFHPQELVFLRDAKSQMKHAWNECNRKMKELSASFEAQIKPHQQILVRSLAQSDENYVVKWDPERLTTMQAAHDAEVRGIELNTQSILSQLQKGIDAIDRRLQDRALLNPEKAELYAQKKNFTTQKVAAVQNGNRLKQVALGKFTEKRRVCAIDIQSADAVRQNEYAIAQAEFLRQCAVINQQRDQSLASYKAEHALVKQQIEQAYERGFSS